MICDFLFSSGYWLDLSRMMAMTQTQMYILNSIVCNCIFCNRDRPKTGIIDELTETQQNYFRKCNIFELNDQFNARNLPVIYPRLCKMLAILGNVPFSVEYEAVYRLFRKCILYLQDVRTHTCILNCE